MTRIGGSVHSVWLGLARLRDAKDSDGLTSAISEELCRSLGFSRVALLRVDDHRLTVLNSYSSIAGDDGATAAMALGFPALRVENELIRRRELSSLALETIERWAAELTVEGNPFVSAPMILDGRVAGLIRADRHGQSVTVDEHDLLGLWAFAEGAGSALERAVLRSRMQAGLDEVVGIAATTDALFDEVAPAVIEFTATRHATPNASPLAATAKLTAREAQVLGLIASGETNAGIARRLLISESTVKSHVKHILRKLDSSHRAEAVSRFLAS